MAGLMKTLLIISQLSYLAAAADCGNEGSCLDGEDETNLLQVDTSVQRGVGRHDNAKQSSESQDDEDSKGFGNPKQDAADAKQYFRICKERSPFCDMRLNLKDQITYEVDWVLDYLERFGIHGFGAPDAIKAWADGIQAKLAELNKKKGAEDYKDELIAEGAKENKKVEVDGDCTKDSGKKQLCSCLNNHDDFKAHLKAEGIDVDKKNSKGEEIQESGKLGRFFANYQSNIWVNLKKASDAITDAGVNEHGRLLASPVCSWTDGEPAWGDALNALKAKIRPEEEDGGFMWTATKGRGIAEDRVHMTTGAQRDILTSQMGDAHHSKQFAFATNKSIEAEYSEYPQGKKASLPGVERWGMTFKNRRLGFFAYGDTPWWVAEVLDAKNYFYEKIIHGMGIHGRNTVPGNPADRMLYVGMPWIGGVSGSVVDFFLAAKLLGFKGKTLTDMCVSDVAFLASAGQHSVSELVFGATAAFSADAPDPKDYPDDEHPFKIGTFRRLIEIMNAPEDKWQEYKKSVDLPTLFTTAMREFQDRTKITFNARNQFTEDVIAAGLGKLKGKVDFGDKCLSESGLAYFKKGMEMRGGIFNAFSTWTDKSRYVDYDSLFGGDDVDDPFNPVFKKAVDTKAIEDMGHDVPGLESKNKKTRVKRWSKSDNKFGETFAKGGLALDDFIELITGQAASGVTEETEIAAIIANIENVRIRKIVGKMDVTHLEARAKTAGAGKKAIEKAMKNAPHKGGPKEALIKLIVSHEETMDTTKEKVQTFMDDTAGDEAAVAARKLLKDTLGSKAPASLTAAWVDSINEKVKALYTCLVKEQGTPKLTKDGITAFYWNVWAKDQPMSATIAPHLSSVIAPPKPKAKASSGAAKPKAKETKAKESSNKESSNKANKESSNKVVAKEEHELNKMIKKDEAEEHEMIETPLGTFPKAKSK